MKEVTIIDDEELTVKAEVDKENGFINFEIKGDKDYLEGLVDNNTPLLVHINGQIIKVGVTNSITPVQLK